MQATPEKERSALSGTIGPLREAAEPHAGGPAAYAHHVALQLLDAFLETEERFSGGAGSPSEQEVIDSLRQVRCLSLAVAAALQLSLVLSFWRCQVLSPAGGRVH